MCETIADKNGLYTKHRLIFTHRHRFASSAQRFDKDRLRLFIKASLPARGVTISGDDRRFACTFAAPTAATSVSAAGPRAGVSEADVRPAGEYFFIFYQSLFRLNTISSILRYSSSVKVQLAGACAHSVICSHLLAPISTEVTPLRLNIHARAIWGSV